MRCSEDEIGEETSRSAIAVNKRMDPADLRTYCDAELVRRPVVSVVSAMADRFERAAALGCNLLLER